MESSDSDEKAEQGCENFVARKPSLWIGEKGYKTFAECEAEGAFLCGEFWVDLQHQVIDNWLPLTYSDRLWNRDQSWRVGWVDSKVYETLDFYGNCFQHFKVKFHVERIKPPDKKWSHYRDTPCAETHLDFNSMDGWLAITVITIVLFLLRKLLVKGARAGLEGAGIARIGARKVMKVVDLGVRKTMKVATKGLGWILYVVVWFVIWNVGLRLAMGLLLPNSWVQMIQEDIWWIPHPIVIW